MNFTLKTMILVRLNVTEGLNLTAAVQMQVKKVLKEAADKATAEDIKAKLEAEGAKVTLK